MHGTLDPKDGGDTLPRDVGTFMRVRGHHVTSRHASKHLPDYTVSPGTQLYWYSAFYSTRRYFWARDVWSIKSPVGSQQSAKFGDGCSGILLACSSEL